jgi:hypothetical protein
MAKGNTGNNISLEIGVPQQGEIKVASQIINDLSSGIYSSPASCIKELVNNSFDADATDVVIRMKPIEDSLTILDNGNGMNAKDFDHNFAWISKSNKRNQGELSAKGRPLIGKIGIGFIAVNEICEVLEVTSSKKGEKIKFTATINFKEIIKSETVVSKEEEVFLKGKFSLINENEDSEEHYTLIRLIGLKEPVLKIFNDEMYKAQVAKSANKDFAKVAFNTMKELLDYHSSRTIYSWENDTEYVQFIIDLASYIPVEYIAGGPIEGVNDKIINNIVGLHKSFHFKVDFDGMYLKKPIFFPKDDKKRQRHLSFNKRIKIKETGGQVLVEGYFYIQNSLLIPRELNGVAIRVKNIPIAERFGYDGTFMRYPIFTEQIFRNWISGELYVKKGLEDAMNIDRTSFRVTHVEYLALQDFLHQFLKEKVFKIAFELYDEGKEEREHANQKRKSEDAKKILSTNKITIRVSPKTKTATKNTTHTSAIPPVMISKEGNSTIIEVDPSLKGKFKKRDWDYLETIFIIMENAFKESRGDTKKLKDLFYMKIVEWKSKK